MGKKKKIREEFNAVYRSGDENKIKLMLEENPWLLDEMTSEIDKNMLEQSQILAALGIMEDEHGGSVKIDEIMLSLNNDLNVRRNKEEVMTILNNAENLGLIKKESDGWILTREGGQVCDEYLNKRFKNLEV
jgi:hypothetical protein